MILVRLSWSSYHQVWLELRCLSSIYTGQLATSNCLQLLCNRKSATGNCWCILRVLRIVSNFRATAYNRQFQSCGELYNPCNQDSPNESWLLVATNQWRRLPVALVCIEIAQLNATTWANSVAEFITWNCKLPAVASCRLQRSCKQLLVASCPVYTQL